jgi:hypothetical protein
MSFHHHSKTSLLLLVISLVSLMWLSGCSISPAPTSVANAPSTPAAHSDDHAGHNHAPETASNAAASAADVPHYFEDPEKAKPFPKTLDPNQFKDPSIKKAYQTAQRIPDVLAQQPCYCYCDKGFGHGSLLHCHIDDHSAG